MKDELFNGKNDYLGFIGQLEYFLNGKVEGDDCDPIRYSLESNLHITKKRIKEAASYLFDSSKKWKNVYSMVTKDKAVALMQKQPRMSAFAGLEFCRIGHNGKVKFSSPIHEYNANQLEDILKFSIFMKRSYNVEN